MKMLSPAVSVSSNKIECLAGIRAEFPADCILDDEPESKAYECYSLSG